MTENHKTDRHVLAFKDSLGNPVREIGRFDAGETVVLTLTMEASDHLTILLAAAQSVFPTAKETARDLIEQIAHERDALAGE